jgi:hypothetical protein
MARYDAPPRRYTMRTLSPAEASILSSLAEEPRAYSLDQFQQLIPNASKDAVDIASVLLKENNALAGASSSYRARIQRSAKTLQGLAASSKRASASQRTR